MPTAIETAAKLYQSRGLVLARDIEAYLAGGYIIATPDKLLLWRACRRASPDIWLADQGEADAWFVGLAVGTGLRQFVREMPYYLPFIAWRRAFKDESARVRTYQTERIIQLTGAT